MSLLTERSYLSWIRPHLWKDVCFARGRADRNHNISADVTVRCRTNNAPGAIDEFDGVRSKIADSFRTALFRQLRLSDTDCLELRDARITRGRISKEWCEQTAGYERASHLTRTSSATTGENELCCGVEC
jgi:hypothetical protein